MTLSVWLRKLDVTVKSRVMKRFVVWAILSCMIIISCKKDSPEETYIHQTSFNSGNEILSSYAPMHATYFPENGEFVSNGGVEYKVLVHI